MVKNHLKRIAMPITWTTKEKKGVVWVARPNPGAHSLEEGMPLVLVIRELLKYANSAREVKNILNHKKILVDGVQRKDHRFNVGFMDTISIPDLKENYRVVLNKFNRLVLIKIDDKEAKEKICQIKGKGLCQGKTQLRLSDGRVILVDKKEKYNTGDSAVITIPEQKILKHIPFEKGVAVLLIKGKKAGVIGTVQEIKMYSEQNTKEKQEDMVVVKSGSETFETLKKYCFVLGKQKSELKIE